MRERFDISIAVPAYGRCEELKQLLASIASQKVLPAEITICEDMSPQRDQIRAIVEEWRPHFEAEQCAVNYSENQTNLGYDGNIRTVIRSSHSKWVMLIGNDDLLLPECVERMRAYLSHKDVPPVVSRSFVRFERNLGNPLGISRISKEDSVFRVGSAPSRMIVRAAGFVGGLILNRDWAESIATDRYDGTLYYQIYLASVAFCGAGIGYIGEPTVAGRSGNAPLFGAAASERSVHIPGSYTPKGRAKMWSSILRITADTGNRRGVDLISDVKHELDVRQSFHIFEMYAGADRKILRELRGEFRQLGLYVHALPRTLYWLDMLFGRYAKFFYRISRRILQR